PRVSECSVTERTGSFSFSSFFSGLAASSDLPAAAEGAAEDAGADFWRFDSWAKTDASRAEASSAQKARRFRLAVGVSMGWDKVERAGGRELEHRRRTWRAAVFPSQC